MQGPHRLQQKLTISSGSQTLNCTDLTRFTGALEYEKRSRVLMVLCYSAKAIRG
jgi:hypothetical protein